MIDESLYRVYYIKFPTGDIKGATMLSPDGFSSIYINVDLSPAEKRKTLKHELRHVERDDFYNGLPIDFIESDF